MNNDGAWLLRCMCDETRFEILELLQEKQELCVGDFVKLMEKDQPLVSHHLKKLKECKMVVSRHEGKKIIYKISSSELAKLIANISNVGKNILPRLCGGDDNGRNIISKCDC